MYETILFDLDGTITVSEYGIIDSVKYALEKFGIVEQDEESLLRFIGPPLYYSFTHFYGMSHEDGEQAVVYYREIYEKVNYKKSPLYDGIREVIQTLYQNGKELYIVTAKPVDTSKEVLRYHNLLPYFKEIYGPSREVHTVNKAELIAKLLTEHNIEDKSKVIMLGDRHYDVKGASDIGVTAVGALYGYGSREELIENGADFLVKTPKDFLKIIEE
ncbi:HAD hydrolase-like protein [Eubacterium oxidoreducens]|uniref:Phosphoglycolate phosphatase n=1 Tax=Eubacterium oxidoreducens TaxID=1732 RepID=A0A1G6CJF8_EUBOX|nr:HAD hydrolase-like protein [Eubacterium oxidoreducens]SDB32875.1 phosphoglycolate phosphatase [Eubacterium oxidoreducens]